VATGFTAAARAGSLRGSRVPCPVGFFLATRISRVDVGTSAVGAEEPEHQPVLLEQVLRLLAPRPGQIILDGTVGLGGHAAALLPRIMPGGRYLGLDLDGQMLVRARDRLGDVSSLALYQANFAEFPEVLARAGVELVDSMLLDLGVNSAQLADPARGFSFEREGPLDMRYDRRQELLALDVVNRLSERELADLLYYNAQELSSRKIAKRICQVRHEGRITSTTALARAVESACAAAGRGRSRIHPATRVFMALRIAVNHELDNLRQFLRRVPEHLRPGGKLAVISFHSLEDGIVKQYLRAAKPAGTLEEITRRPVIATPDERRANPRSRSAKLRVAVRLGPTSPQGGSHGHE
jgi:16S rRNA (cytosine1402-N4)-methyltransferase